MSAKNGDKARHNRIKKRNTYRRTVSKKIREAATAPKPEASPVVVEPPVAPAAS